MALQGTLDTFALPDVLRLLASTRKTGRLRVSGNRGTGSVWVDGGGVTGSEATGVTDAANPSDVLFELLRYADGSFTFEAGTSPVNPTAPADVEPLLIDAEHQLLEWREIEAVVPSMDAWVRLVPELPRPDVVVDADRWRTIVAVGGGASVTSLGQSLALSEVPVCRIVKDLVESGLATVEAAPEPIAPVVVESHSAMTASDNGVNGSSAQDLTTSIGPSFASLAEDAPFTPFPGVERLNGATTPLEQEPVSLSLEPADLQVFDHEAEQDTPEPQPEPVEVAEADEPVVVADEEAPEADEVARQLASLSPKAARAVAAAARAETDEEREAALAQVTGEDDEPINRGLLLKFLSSVRS